MDLNDLKVMPPWEWPSSAGETLKRILPDRQTAASDRIIAAGLAGDLVVMDDEMAGLLLSLVRDAAEPEELRVKAAISLGPALEETDIEGFDDELSEPPIAKETFDRIQEILRRIYSDQSSPKFLRRRVLEASVRAPRDWHTDAIRAAWSSQDEDWKLTAAFCMRWVAGFEDQILEALKSRNPDIHYEAVCAAGDWEVDRAWPHVAALLTSKTIGKNLRLAAIEAAPGIGHSEAEDILVDLSTSEDEEIAEAADEALQMMDPFDDDEEEEEDD